MIDQGKGNEKRMNELDNQEQKMHFIGDLMACIDCLYFWIYDEQLNLLDSNCPTEKNSRLWDAIFHLVCTEELQQHLIESIRTQLINDRTGLLWFVTPSANLSDSDKSIRLYVLGPVSPSPLAEQELVRILNERVSSVALRKVFSDQFKNIPVLSHTTFLSLGTMIHLSATGERIRISDIEIAPAETSHTQSSKTSDQKNTVRHGGEEYEALLLQMIEEGNLHYQQILKEHIYNGQVGQLAVGDSLRQFKNEIITSVTLCSRAAIRGGLPRETALTLSDLYIQSIEAANTIAEVAEIYQRMRDDYVHRVHDTQEYIGLSQPIRECISAVQLHILEPITVAFIAKCVGYSYNHISHLFHVEMGKPLSRYITEQKIEHAKLLLASSDRSAEDIADLLHFSSPSHFASVFRKMTGMTPSQYRKEA